jgi:hypothetical protein
LEGDEPDLQQRAKGYSQVITDEEREPMVKGVRKRLSGIFILIIHYISLLFATSYR